MKRRKPSTSRRKTRYAPSPASPPAPLYREEASAHGRSLRASEKAANCAGQVSSLEKAAESTLMLMQNGSTTYLEVLTAQQTLLEARIGEVSNTLSEISSTITLYTALGGGVLQPESANPLSHTPNPLPAIRRQQEAVHRFYTCVHTAVNDIGPI